jgi:hypothetical protein
MSKEINLSVIIVNWNGKHLLKDCLDSILNQTYENFNVILIDNGSDDGSVDFIENNYKTVILIKLKKNTGFAYANNIGIKEAFKNKNLKYIITLNNDTKADKDYIKYLVEEANKDEKIGSLQPKVLNFFEKNKIDSVGMLIGKDCSAINRGQKEIDKGQYDKKEEIFGASASSSLYTKKALEEVRLSKDQYFDNDYFAYYEDVDLAWRLRLAGFKSFYIPSSKVLHIHSATGKSFSPFKAFHIHRNQYFNIIKNFPSYFLIRAMLLMFIGYFSLLLDIFKKRGPSANLNKNAKGADNIIFLVIKSWWHVLINLPKTLVKRRKIQKTKRINKEEYKKLFIDFSK